MRHYPTNRYTGVNAHLNSYIQQANGMYSPFHHEMISFIRSHLDKVLPANFYAHSEQGLQLHYSDEGAKKRLPDISVFETRPSKDVQSREFSNPTATIPIIELAEEVSEEDIPMRVGVYQVEPNDPRGKLVTAIEVLSPANKPKGSNFADYSQKRLEFLERGINLFEIDLLHESPSVVSRLPSYPSKNENAYPYNFLISTPIPNYKTGTTKWYGVAVDSPLPALPLPLTQTETVALDLQIIYNTLFADVRFYHQFVDYDTLPVNFSAYRKDDQQRIQAMLEIIRQENP
jgi:hypothetical protein